MPDFADMKRPARRRYLDRRLRRLRRVSPHPGRVRGIGDGKLTAKRTERVADRIGGRLEQRLENVDLPSVKAFNRRLEGSGLGRRAFIQKRMRPVRRERRLDENPLYNPSVQLSGGDLFRAAKRLSKIETRPELLALKQQIDSTLKQSTQLSSNVTDYYKQLAAEEAKSVDRQRAIGERTNTELKTIADETSAANQQGAAEADQRAAADESLRGEGLEGGARAQLAAELAARQGVASGSAQAFRSAGALQGAGAETLSQAMRRAGMMRGGETQQEIARRTANTLGDLNEKRADVKSSRGQLATKYLTDLRQSGFENLVTARGLDIEQSQLQADAAEAASDASLARKQLRSTNRHNRALERLSHEGHQVTARGQDISAQQQAANRRATNRRARRENRQQNRQDRGERRHTDKSQRGVGAIRQALDIYRRVGDMSEAADKLRRNDFNVEIINAAAGLFSNGYVSQNTIRALRQMGVYVPRDWRPPRKRR